jgi:hypothetical protein
MYSVEDANGVSLPPRPPSAIQPSTGMANEVSTASMAMVEISGNSSSLRSCCKTAALALTSCQLRDRRSNMSWAFFG